MDFARCCERVNSNVIKPKWEDTGGKLMILEKIQDAASVKDLNMEELTLLAEEIREFLIGKISCTGGHLASNLGVVELTIALYLAFDLPRDKVIWDVGHQSYTHKILSGRKELFDDLRQFGGISGFPKRRESSYDAFDTGHSSTSISAGLGIAQGRDLQGEDYSVVSIIGDGALTGGMAYEALNNAARLKKNFIIVLNDNNMSISENVGGMSRYLNGIRTGDGYIDLKKNVANALERIPGWGQNMIDRIKRTKNGIKQLLIPGMLFENMGITYLGPVDGHDIRQLQKALLEAKKLDHAVLVHVLTKKGRGFAPAEKNPAKFHGVGPFDVKTGEFLSKKKYPDYTDVFARALCRLAKEDSRIVAVTAAMPDGTGVWRFAKKFPRRFFDVGIAEAHAVTSAAGMAAAGLKPVVAVYSSFLQRGFDQILHDICIQELPVVLAVDRAGLVGSDGETHQGIFDYSFLSCIPNMTVMAPKNWWELEDMLAFALKINRPAAVRYPRGEAYRGLKEFHAPITYGKGELLYDESGNGAEIALLAVGSMVSTAEHIRDKLRDRGILCSLANGRFIKPFDTELVHFLAERHKVVITLEENVLQGGFGLQVTGWIHEHRPEVRAVNIALPDAYVEHGNVSVLRESLGIDSDSIIRRLETMGIINDAMNEKSENDTINGEEESEKSKR